MAKSSLIDPITGKPIEYERLTIEESAPTVTGVRSILSGHPAQGLTPTRLARLLLDAEQGDALSYLELAEEMEEKDLHYRSVLATRKLQVAGLEVKVDAASDDKADVAAADLVRGWLDRLELQDELFDILDAVGKGFSVTEIIWETSGGQWLPARLEWRDPRWFEFDQVGGRRVMLRSEQGPQPLKPYGYITHVSKSKSGLPIRGGLARTVAWAYLFKNFDIKAWTIFLEVYGHPLRVGKYGQGASERDKAVLLAAVRNIAKDAAAIIPREMEIEFVRAEGASANADMFQKNADWWDRQVSKAVLGQTGTTDVGQHVGTSDAHERVRNDIEASDAQQLSATLTRDLARPMIDLNLGPRKAYPIIRVFRPDPEDLDALVSRVEKLVPLGLRVERSWMADRIGVPDPDAGAELLTAPGAAPAEPPAEEKPARANNRVAAQSQELPSAAPDAIDELAAEQLADWQPLVKPLLDPIQAALESASSYEEFLAMLPGLVAEQDPAALTEALAKAAFAARLAGETETELG